MNRLLEVSFEHLPHPTRRGGGRHREWPAGDQCPPDIEQSSGQWQRFAIDALNARVDRIESAQRPSPPLSLLEARNSLNRKLAQLRQVLTEDEVEADATYLSLKRELAALRKSSKAERLRSFALGLVHDALLFTRFKQVTPEGLQGLESALGLATEEELSDATLDQIEDLLQSSGFELVPIE